MLTLGLQTQPQVQFKIGSLWTYAAASNNFQTFSSFIKYSRAFLTMDLENTLFLK